MGSTSCGCIYFFCSESVHIQPCNNLLIQCWFNFGSPSARVDQHENSTGVKFPEHVQARRFVPLESHLMLLGCTPARGIVTAVCFSQTKTSTKKTRNNLSCKSRCPLNWPKVPHELRSSCRNLFSALFQFSRPLVCLVPPDWFDLNKWLSYADDAKRYRNPGSQHKTGKWLSRKNEAFFVRPTLV